MSCILQQLGYKFGLDDGRLRKALNIEAEMRVNLAGMELISAMSLNIGDPHNKKILKNHK